MVASIAIVVVIAIELNVEGIISVEQAAARPWVVEAVISITLTFVAVAIVIALEWWQL